MQFAMVLIDVFKLKFVGNLLFSFGTNIYLPEGKGSLSILKIFKVITWFIIFLLIIWFIFYFFYYYYFRGFLVCYPKALFNLVDTFWLQLLYTVLITDPKICSQETTKGEMGKLLFGSFEWSNSYSNLLEFSNIFHFS